MISKNVTVNLKQGGGATPVAMLVQVASGFESSVHIIDGEKKINAKSIMGMMTLSLKNGEELTVMAEGADEEAAVTAMEDFIIGR